MDRTPLVFSQSRTLRNLLADIAEATRALNTIHVGLESVAEGHGGQGAVVRAWPKPKTAEKARAYADEASTFACRSAIVFAAEVFDSYLCGLANEEWAAISIATREIVLQTQTRKKKDGGGRSVAERAEALLAELGSQDPLKIAALDLLVRWRNLVAHDSKDSRSLHKTRIATLTKCADEFQSRQRPLNIVQALEHYDAGRPPLPIEVTTLIAFSVRLAQEIDVAVIARAVSTISKFEHTADFILKAHFDLKNRTLVSLNKEMDKFRNADPSTRRHFIRSILSKSGLSPRKPGSLRAKKGAKLVELPEAYLQEVSQLRHEDFKKRFTTLLR